jgi:hypothetical protein
VRTTAAIFIILLGLAWEFSAEVRNFVDPATAQKLQGWLEAHATLINQIVPLVLIVGGVFWIGVLYAWPVLHGWFQSRPLEIIYKPPAHTSMWRNMRDYYIEVRNCTTDRTIFGVIVTWDQTPFTRFIDRKLHRDCLLSPTSIEPSSSESVLLFSLKDDLGVEESKNDELRRPSTFTIRVIGKGMAESTARFKYEPNKIPKLRKLWR